MAIKTTLLSSDRARKLLEEGHAIYNDRNANYVIPGHGRLHRNFVGGLVRRDELQINWDMSSWILKKQEG